MKIIIVVVWVIKIKTEKNVRLNVKTEQIT